jgi:hypothetical protein
MTLHEAICLIAGWNFASVAAYFYTHKLVSPPKRTGKVYFDPFQTMPDTPRSELLARCRR